MKNIRIGDKRIGEKIKQARAKKYISQKNLGNKLNLPKQSICSIEKGNRTVSLSRLLEIAKVTNQPIEFFYEFEDFNPEDMEAVDKIIEIIRSKRKGSKN